MTVAAGRETAAAHARGAGPRAPRGRAADVEAEGHGTDVAAALLAGGRREEALAEARIEERAGKIADPAWRASFVERVPEHARTAAPRGAWSA
ncbi:hypothetical protein WME76_41655 [Sorangium sp. So ce119]|uniref:hypothetical protein n=1 Tax=Sorangium sp. So ce119 TaxID=3133279 RepID=UPI003F5DA862